MGWDCYAVFTDKDGCDNRTRDLPEEVLKDFKEASEEIWSRGIGRDGMLERGGLDCSDCAYALERMSGISAWSDHTPEEIKEAFEASQKYDPIEEDLGDNLWAYESAKAFLRISAKHGLGYYASY